MYAIVRSGGSQYRAEVGKYLNVQKVDKEVGDKLELDVLMIVDNGDVQLGRPVLEEAKVTVTVVEQFRGKKIRVWKYKPRKRYRRRRGHRQYYTRLRVDDIQKE